MEKKAIVKLEERQIDNYKRTEVVGKFRYRCVSPEAA